MAHRLVDGVRVGCLLSQVGYKHQGTQRLRSSKHSGLRMYMASQRYEDITLVKEDAVDAGKISNLHSLTKGTLGYMHLEGRPIFFAVNVCCTAEWWVYQHPRAEHEVHHPPSGMSEWRGHHYASGHAVLDRHMCCSRWTMRRPARAGQRTSSSSRLRSTRPAQGKREPAGMWKTTGLG